MIVSIVEKFVLFCIWIVERKSRRAILNILLVLSLLVAYNPLYRPVFMIERLILKITPLGMQIDDVLCVVENHNEWELMNFDYKYGFSSMIRDNEKSRYGKKTYMYVWACIGEYRIIFDVSVCVYWGFDKNGELVDIYITEDVDSL